MLYDIYTLAFHFDLRCESVTCRSYYIYIYIYIYIYSYIYYFTCIRSKSEISSEYIEDLDLTTVVKISQYLFYSAVPIATELLVSELSQITHCTCMV